MTRATRTSLILATLIGVVLGMQDASAAVNATPAAGMTSGAVRPPRIDGIDLDTTTIPELQTLMDDGQLSSVQITKLYIHRIRQLNPKLHAVITVSPTARADARRADRKRARGVEKPLLGIPALVKDNVDTTGMATTAGSWALDGSTPANAFIARRMKAAGALIIGKANLSEWANFRSSPSSSGWSGIGGQTNMPYVLNRNPCGSSSGSAVGAAADLATVAVGTETDGSIVCPSGQNGIVGIKPTLGLASRSGIIPISADQDTAGPMARNVTDAAVLLGALTGVDKNDAATADQVGHVFTDYTRFLDGKALGDARIGVWRDGTYDPGRDPEVDAMLDSTIDALRGKGATIVDDITIPIGPAYGPEFDALLCEFKDDLASYLDSHTGPSYPKTLQDLIDFNAAHPELEGPWNSYLFFLAQRTDGRDDPDCSSAREQATSVAQAAINDALEANNLDAIIAPTNSPAWLTDPVRGDHSSGVGSSSPAAIAGYASITVPGGYAGSLPLGVSFIGGRWDEPKLIGLGYAFEQATKIRVPPQFLDPTAGDSGTTSDVVPSRSPNLLHAW